MRGDSGFPFSRSSCAQPGWFSRWHVHAGRERRRTLQPNRHTPESAMYTIVIPIYNEEQTLPVLHDRLMTTLSGLDQPFEVILVDDGSRDRSYQLMLDSHQKDPRVKVLRLSRNFGHQVAISAGRDRAAGG